MWTCDEIRKAAAPKLDDQGLFSEITMNDESGNVRIFAVDKLEDKALAQDIYADVVKHVGCWDRDIAETLERLYDQAALADVALHAKDNHMRVATADKLHAVQQLTDQAVQLN